MKTLINKLTSQAAKLGYLIILIDLVVILSFSACGVKFYAKKLPPPYKGAMISKIHPQSLNK